MTDQPAEWMDLQVGPLSYRAQRGLEIELRWTPDGPGLWLSLDGTTVAGIPAAEERGWMVSADATEKPDGWVERIGTAVGWLLGGTIVAIVALAVVVLVVMLVRFLLDQL